MIGWNNSAHVPPEHFPANAVVVQSKDSNKSLDMIVNESMVELGIRLFQCLCDDAVPRKKLEVYAG